MFVCLLSMGQRIGKSEYYYGTDAATLQMQQSNTHRYTIHRFYWLCQAGAVVRLHGNSWLASPLTFLPRAG